MAIEFVLQWYREFPPLVNWMYYLLVNGSAQVAGFTLGAGPLESRQGDSAQGGSWFTALLAVVYFIMKARASPFTYNRENDNPTLRFLKIIYTPKE